MEYYRDYYKILNVNKEDNQKEINKAYRELVKKYHPDKNRDNPMIQEAEEKIKMINEAYEVLGNPHKREEYDLRYSQTEEISGTCSEHPNREAVDKCRLCNSPLCQECAGRFNFVSCSQCFMEFKEAYQKRSKKPFVIARVVVVAIGLLGFFIFLTYY